MKKITSFVLALFSTLFLAVGATRAAENFDALGQLGNSNLSNPVPDLPGAPCGTIPE